MKEKNRQDTSLSYEEIIAKGNFLVGTVILRKENRHKVPEQQRDPL